jgi:hypothetical protein
MQDSDKHIVGLQDSLSRISNDITKLGSQVKQREKELALSETKLKEIQSDQLKLEDLLINKRQSMKVQKIHEFNLR